MRCESCGLEFKEGNKFCTHCGAPAEAEAKEAARVSQPKPAHPGLKERISGMSTTSKWVAGGVAALVVVGIVLAIVLPLTMSSTAVEITNLTLTREDGKKIDLKTCPSG